MGDTPDNMSPLGRSQYIAGEHMLEEMDEAFDRDVGQYPFDGDGITLDMPPLELFVLGKALDRFIGEYGDWDHDELKVVTDLRDDILSLDYIDDMREYAVMIEDGEFVVRKVDSVQGAMTMQQLMSMAQEDDGDDGGAGRDRTFA